MALDTKEAAHKISHPSPKTWKTIRVISQILSFLFFFSLIILTHQNNAKGDLVKFPLWLSPLAMLTNFLSNHRWIGGMGVAILVFLSAFVVGRLWCGWFCPLGTLIDIFSWKRKNRKTEPPDERWRKIKFLILFVILAAAVMGNLTLLFLDPITIFIRSFTTAIIPGLDQLIWQIETALYQFPPLREWVANVDGFLRPFFLPSSPQKFLSAGWIFLFLSSILALNLIAERFWCRYICPLGGLIGLLSKLGIFKRDVRSSCIECNRCARICPTGTIDNRKDYSSDPAECTWCMNCLAVCPNKSNVFTMKLHPAAWEKYDPDRRELISALALGISSAVVLRSESSISQLSLKPLRPPGVNNQRFLDQCVRCGECVRVCPTTALQPSLFESGVQGIWTPILVPRLGYCDYSCNACGRICPVEAIPPLQLPEKRVWKIGSAYIDENRCLAWSDGIPCIVCEEMCPLPFKAITLREAKGSQIQGEENSVQLPVVNRDLCIGCGICEYKCPVVGEAAIRVYQLQIQN